MPLPLGLLSAAGVVAGLAGRPAGLLGLLAAAGILDDVSGGPHVFRRLLRHRTTWNVTGTAGDPEAADTLVFVAHHDAANGGLIFRPELNRLVADTFPEWYARQTTSPQMMRCPPAPRWRASARSPGCARCAGPARSWRRAARWRSSTSARARSSRAPTTTSPPWP